MNMVAEYDVKRKTVNQDWFVDIFSTLGVKEGMDLIVHSGLGSLRVKIEKGPDDVIDALLKVIGVNGTVMMPSHTGHLTDPADWLDPPVPEHEIPAIIEQMEPFDPITTKIRNRGVLTNEFILRPGIKRSCHPLNSVIALGPKAEYFTEIHPLHESEGYGSPAWRFYNEQGYALLIGVDIPNSLTFIHLGEFLLNKTYLNHETKRVLIVDEGRKKFLPLKKYPVTGKFFAKLHPVLEKMKLIRMIRINSAIIYLIPYKKAIDLTIDMMKDEPNIFNEP